MKTMALVVTALILSVVSSIAETNRVEIVPPLLDQAATSTAKLEAETEVGPPAELPNEIRRGKYSFRGVFVQLSKTDNPAQLVNPFAPAEYGDGSANLIEEPATGKQRGLLLFSFSF